MTNTAVITIAHGRHAHWRAQERALARSAVPPDTRILVAIDDPDLVEAATAETPGAHVIALDAHPLGLPLARARNAGARAAVAGGAEVLIFLDIDCLPAPELVGAYHAAAREAPGHLLSGPVTYLSPPPATGYDLTRLGDLDAPHPARPSPPPGDLQVGGSHDLFWSLSFAVDAATWTATGGFDEQYIGYGGEDTDFAYRAARRRIPMAWVGSARAYHQHHPAESPPVHHLDAILRNATLFRARWGVWPMRGWLDAFERLELIEASSDGTEYRRTRRTRRRAPATTR